jgi:hypothetical protein
MSIAWHRSTRYVWHFRLRQCQCALLPVQQHCWGTSCVMLLQFSRCALEQHLCRICARTIIAALPPHLVSAALSHATRSCPRRRCRLWLPALCQHVLVIFSRGKVRSAAAAALAPGSLSTRPRGRARKEMWALRPRHVSENAWLHCTSTACTCPDGRTLAVGMHGAPSTEQKHFRPCCQQSIC